MKFIVGIIRGTSLEKLTQALGRAGVYRLTVSEVEVVDVDTRSPPRDDERRLRVEIALNDSFLGPALDAFEMVRGQGEPAWVSVLPLDDVVRIRTGETGPDAI